MSRKKSQQSSKQQQLRVTLIRSTIATLQAHKNCVRGLGLRRIRHTVTVEDSPCVRGMINQVRHMVTVEEINNAS